MGLEMLVEARGTERLVECFVFFAAVAFSLCTAESFSGREGKANEEVLLIALSFNASSRSAVVLASLLSSLGVPTTKLFGFSVWLWLVAVIAASGSCQPAAMTASGGESFFVVKDASLRAGTGSTAGLGK